jgi:hypothetical protein
MNELDHFLQRMVTNIESVDALACAIDLKVTSGESVSIRKTYVSTALDANRKLKQKG